MIPRQLAMDGRQVYVRAGMVSGHVAAAPQSSVTLNLEMLL
jgi:hypothetical protein